MTNISRDADLCNIARGMLQSITAPSFDYTALESLLQTFSATPTGDKKRELAMQCIETTLLPCSAFFLVKPHRSLIQTKHLKESSRTLKNVEDVVISLNKDYREHFTHQLRVFLTGLCILSNDIDVWIDHTRSYEANLLSQVFTPYVHDATTARAIIDEFSNQFVGYELSDSSVLKEWWALTSLMHDMGYPPVNLQFLTNRKLSEMYGGLFAYYRFRELELIPREYFDRQMDEFMESIAFAYPDVPELLAFLDSLRSESDHGLIGAIVSFPRGILSDILRDIENIKDKFEKRPGFMLEIIAGFHVPVLGAAIPKSTAAEYEEMSRFFKSILYVQGLLCISLHNKPYFYFASPLLELLVLSDNLQEWGRTEHFGLETVKMDKKGGAIEFEFTYNDKESATCFYKKLAACFDYTKDGPFLTTGLFHDFTPERASEFMERIHSKFDNSLTIDFRFVVLHKEGSNLTSVGSLFICNKCGNASRSLNCLKC